MCASPTRSGFAPVPTSRTPAGRTTPDGTRWVRFDLNDRSTWTNLPPADAYAWLFPAAPLDAVMRLARHLDPGARRVVVVGTTSSYLHEKDGETVTEQNPLDVTQERVRGEEYLRGLGATVIRAAGIYGPALGPHAPRNPLSWLRRGMISSPDSIVNLIHVSDLAAAILEALKRGIRGEQMIASDGTPRRWGDIAEWAVRSGMLDGSPFSGDAPAAPPARAAQSGRKLSKRLSNGRMLSLLGPVISHGDLFVELRDLERV